MKIICMVIYLDELHHLAICLVYLAPIDFSKFRKIFFPYIKTFYWKGFLYEKYMYGDRPRRDPSSSYRFAISNQFLKTQISYYKLLKKEGSIFLVTSPLTRPSLWGIRVQVKC